MTEARRGDWHLAFFDELYWRLCLARPDATADAEADRIWRASGLAGSPSGLRILDQGSGGGEVARAFGRLGGRVMGIETSRDLVALAAAAGGATYAGASAEDPCPMLDGEAYGLAYNFYSGIGYHGLEAARAFLRRAGEALSPGAPYVVETMNGDHLRANFQPSLRTTRVDAATGRSWTVLRESALPGVGDHPLSVPRLSQRWTFSPDDGGPGAFVRESVVDLLGPSSLAALATSAGFEEVAVMDSATLGPVGPGTERLMVRMASPSDRRRGRLATGFAASLSARMDAPCIVDGPSLDGRACLDWAARAEVALSAARRPDGGPAALAILAPRSWTVPLSILAARGAGMAFLCLDTDAPDGRIADILSRTRPSALVAHEGDLDRARGILASAGLSVEVAVALECPADGLERTCVVTLASPRALPPGTSHLAFTSGSSGSPKGVLLPEDGLVDTVTHQAAILGDDGGPSAWMLNPAFDASLSDILVAVLGRRALVVHRQPATRAKSLLSTLSNVAVTDIPPALMRVVDPASTSLRSVVFGGERADAGAVRRWGRQVRAFQAYGPTESSVCATMARAWDGWEDGMLGRPLPNQCVLLATDSGIREVVPEHPDASPDDPGRWNRTVLLDASGTRIEGPATGEILLAGEALALGYLGDEAMTAARFGSEGGRRIHLTGDVASWSDGHLRWTGRADRQVKLNGRLVCPEEVEAVVSRLLGLVSACVPGPRGLRLVVETDDASAADGAAALVASVLGDAFRPRSVEAIPAMPRTANGKVDLPALSTARRREAA